LRSAKARSDLSEHRKVSLPGYRTKQNKAQHKKHLAQAGCFWYNFQMQTSEKKRVGIIRGGSGSHYETSLKKGGDIITYIFENLSDKYKPVDILVDKDYIWHSNGLPISPSDLAHKIDVAWNVSHPSFSSILESLSIPTIGAGSFASTLENSGEILREHLKSLEIKMPRQIILPQNARAVLEKFPAPWKVGDKLVKTFLELTELIGSNTSILVEEFISGKVASVHSVAGFRGEDVYTFPPGNVFGNFSHDEREQLIKIAQDLHSHIGAKHYLRSSFVVNKRGKVYLLDIQSIPNLKSGSHFTEACESVGAKMHNVVEHILERALVI